MNRYVCIHGHFYQPPRENPWLEAVELQDSSYPYHDWNERITAECYAPNASSRILDQENNIVQIVSNYEGISFNFGPTLLSWMEKYAPETYAMVLNADTISQKRFSGHGAALAQVYNHMIMPLANSRDKRTQIVWGIQDFMYRFGRMPEGMWLAETAVDLETLDLLATYGIRFTILSPYQALQVRKLGDKEWQDAASGRVDPKQPYLCNLESGRQIAIFFYDGPVSQEIAFGNLLGNGERCANRLLGLFGPDQTAVQLAHIATDGETYGHHHRYGEMALSYALHHVQQNNLARPTIYGEFLEKFPPTQEVRVQEKSSWSCVHGLERWRADCGCCSGMHPGWKQAWRKPLRETLDWLRERLVELHDEQAANYLTDPWKARDDYILVVLKRTPEQTAAFLSDHARHELTATEKIAVLKLLECQRHAMLMYTSCGWFFDEISGIETVQIMQYAARAMQLCRELGGPDLEMEFISRLEQAPSNIPEYKNGAQVYRRFVQPKMLDLQRVASHYAVSSLFEDYPQKSTIYCYSAETEQHKRVEAGRHKMASGTARIRSLVTLEEQRLCYVALHWGDHNLLGGVCEHPGEAEFIAMQEEIEKIFQKQDMTEIIHCVDRYFGPHHYSFWHLFKDEQRKVLNQILEMTLKEVEGSFRQINENHYPILQVLKESNIPLPKVLATTLEFVLNMDVRKALESEPVDLARLETLVEEADRWNCELDRKTLGFVASRRLNGLMLKLRENLEDTGLLQTIAGIFRILQPLSLSLSLWNAQNVYFSIGRKVFGTKPGQALTAQMTKEWETGFHNLGAYLRIRIR